MVRKRQTKGSISIISLLIVVLYSHIALADLSDGLTNVFVMNDTYGGKQFGSYEFDETNGVTVTTTKCIEGSCIYFDNGGDYLQQDADDLRPTSLSIWFSPTSVSNKNFFTSFVAPVNTHNVDTRILWAGFTTSAVFVVGETKNIVVSYVGGNKWKVFHNGAFVGNYTNTTVLNINTLGRQNSADAQTGYYDEWYMWNRTLTNEEMVSLNDTFWPFTAPAVPSNPTANTSMVFYNLSGSYKDIFSADEDIWIAVNYTYAANGTAITDGSCNITTKNFLYENTSSNDNFTLCDSGCDHSSFSESLKVQEATGGNMDFVKFEGCHEELAQGNINVSLSCVGGYYSRLVLASELPVCNGDNPYILVNSTVCNGQEEIILNLTYTGTNNRRKQINNLEILRQNAEFLHEDVSYNSTNKLYVSDHTVEHYIPAQYYSYANCSKSDAYFLNSSVIDSVSVADAPPDITFSLINNSYGTSSLTSGVVIEFSSSMWFWYGSVTDTNLDFFSVSWYNSSSDLLTSYHVRSPFTEVLNTSGSLFVPYGTANSYNISVFANDTVGNSSFASLSFNVSDSFAPVITNLSTTVTIQNNTNITWRLTLSDDYLWSFNNSCDNGFVSKTSSIGNSSMSYIDTMLIVDDTLCTFTLCDGHTDSTVSFKDKSVDYIDKKIKVDDMVLSYDIDLEQVRLIDKKDRVSFCVAPADKNYFLEFSVPSFCIPASDSGYKGHFICGSYWIDFENDLGLPVVQYTDRVIVDLNGLKTGTEEICFDSIGQINCVTETQTIYSTTDGVASYDVNLIPSSWSTTFDVSTTSGVLLLFFLFFVCLVVLVIGFVTGIPAIIGFAGVMWFFFGFIVTLSVSYVFGSLLIILGIIFIILSVNYT